MDQVHNEVPNEWPNDRQGLVVDLVYLGFWSFVFLKYQGHSLCF